MSLSVVGVLLIAASCVAVELFTDEDNARLPTLFHLDDHDRCLLQKDGLYCLGDFELSPTEQNSTVFEYIMEYSSNPYTFNRSRLYRGYCVSARCPSSERNASLRFERCVDERMRRHALSARLRTLQYCTTQKQLQQTAEQPPDAAQQLFLQVVYALLVLNLVGTVYDVALGDREKKNGILMAWSVRASWRRLTATYDDGDPRLKKLEPIQGLRLYCVLGSIYFKVMIMLITIYAHTCIQHSQFYVMNPNFLENLSFRTDGVLIANGTSLIQLYVMMSTFLTAYNLLLYSQTRKLSFQMLPILLFKRMIRLTPVHLLLVGYAATWWPYARSGALSAVIGEKFAICRRKFWTHAFFLNNVVEKYDTCFAPTWFLPVDMHLYIVACVFTIIMSRRRNQALRLYVILFIISGLFCGVVNYITEWKAIIYISVPEKVRGIFINEESFGGFYTSSWGSLPACFLGLFTAHLHYELQEKKYDCNENKWLCHIHGWTVPVASLWVIVVGKCMRWYTQPLVTAAYVAADRPAFCIIMFFLLFGVFNIEGIPRWVLGGRGWRVMARLSLPVMLVHWLVSVVICARPTAYHTSVFDISVDYLATVFYTYVIAVPIALLLEIPAQRFFSQFI